jgi:NADH-quinone oxidoreductase subunit M
MLVAILVLYFISQPPGSRSFDYAEIYNSLLPAIREVASCNRGQAQACASMSPLAANLKIHGPWMFFAFAIAFAVKVPMFPVHTWLPDAHVQAPSAGSMILAGVMLKMGTFGFWRYAIPLFPVTAREHRPLLSALAIIGIVYGALMCLAQRDIKKLIAYSSISHLGLVMLGMLALTTEGASGSAYQMLNHGLSTGALFLMFGMLYERRHLRLISDYGGIARVMPAFSALFLIIVFSSIAVPGTNGFVGEFLVLLGTFKSSLPREFGVLGALGVVLGAAYMLWMVQRVFFGQITDPENQRLGDLNVREFVTVLPFVGLVIGMGVVPQPFLDRLAPSAALFAARANVGDPGSTAPDGVLRIQAMGLAGRTSAREAAEHPAPAPDRLSSR